MTSHTISQLQSAVATEVDESTIAEQVGFSGPTGPTDLSDISGWWFGTFEIGKIYDIIFGIFLDVLLIWNICYDIYIYIYTYTYTYIHTCIFLGKNEPNLLTQILFRRVGKTTKQISFWFLLSSEESSPTLEMRESWIRRAE